MLLLIFNIDPPKILTFYKRFISVVKFEKKNFIFHENCFNYVIPQRYKQNKNDRIALKCFRY